MADLRVSSEFAQAEYGETPNQKVSSAFASVEYGETPNQKVASLFVQIEYLAGYEPGYGGLFFGNG